MTPRPVGVRIWFERHCCIVRSAHVAPGRSTVGATSGEPFLLRPLPPERSKKVYGGYLAAVTEDLTVLPYGDRLMHSARRLVHDRDPAGGHGDGAVGVVARH